MQVYYCDVCGARVTEGEIQRGKAVLTEDGCFCAACMAEMGAQGEAAAAEPVVIEDEEVEAAPPPDARTATRKPPSSRRRSRYAPARPAGARNLAVPAVIGGVLVLFLVFLAYFAFRSPGPAEPVLRHQQPVKEAGAASAGAGAATTSRPGAEKPQESQPPQHRRPLGEGMRITIEPEPPKPKPGPKPAEKPQPPPPPRPKPKPQPRPTPPSRPASGQWTSIFNGRDFTGWRQLSGRAEVQNGALVSMDDADLYYPADWAEFDLELEMRAEKMPGSPDSLAGCGVCQWQPGRGKCRVHLVFHSDGDCHGYVKRGGKKERTWRSGAGKFPLKERWVKVRFELRRRYLKVYSDGEEVGHIDLSGTDGENERGGFYFFGNEGNVARLRNARVRVISR